MTAQIRPLFQCQYWQNLKHKIMITNMKSAMDDNRVKAIWKQTLFDGRKHSSVWTLLLKDGSVYSSFYLQGIFDHLNATKP